MAVSVEIAGKYQPEFLVFANLVITVDGTILVSSGSNYCFFVG
jgi:hypothetical protein